MMCIACSGYVYPEQAIYTQAFGLENMPDRRDAWHPACFDLVRNHSLNEKQVASALRRLRERPEGY